MKDSLENNNINVIDTREDRFRYINPTRNGIIGKVEELACTAVNSGDEKAIDIGESALEFLHSPSIGERIDDAKLDSVVCLTGALIGHIYLGSMILKGAYDIHQGNFTLAHVALMYESLPFGGLSGLLRTAYLGIRGIYYSKKYNESIYPKLITATLLCFDGGYLLAPIEALNDEKGNMRNLYQWSLKNKLSKSYQNIYKSLLSYSDMWIKYSVYSNKSI